MNEKVVKFVRVRGRGSHVSAFPCDMSPVKIKTVKWYIVVAWNKGHRLWNLIL